MLFSTGQVLCPVIAMKAYLAVAGEFEPTAPLLRCLGGKALCRKQFLDLLHKTLNVRAIKVNLSRVTVSAGVWLLVVKRRGFRIMSPVP